MCVFTIWLVHHIFWILGLPSVGGFIALRFPQTSVCATPVFDSFMMFRVSRTCPTWHGICATYSWSEVRILESGFIGSIWVCKHWDPQIHWQIMMLPIILAIDLRMFFFWGGKSTFQLLGQTNISQHMIEVPIILICFDRDLVKLPSWQVMQQALAPTLAPGAWSQNSQGGRGSSSSLSSRMSSLEEDMCQRQAQLIEERVLKESACPKWWKKNLGKLKGGVLRWKLIGREDGKMDENGKLHAQDGSTSVYMWIQIWIDMQMGNTLPSGFEFYCTC